MLFRSKDYRQALATRLAERRKHVPAATRHNLAEYCGVQPGYLSRALNQKIHLSRDQVWMIAEYLRLQPAETEFVLLLHEQCRSANENRKLAIKVDIEQIQQAQDRTESSVTLPPANPTKPIPSEFYLDPEAQLVHLALSLPRFRGKAQECSQMLGLNKKRWSQVIKNLEKWKLIELVDGSISTIESDFHLSSDSQLYRPYRVLMRQFSQEKMRTVEDEDGYFFSALFSADEDSKLKIRQIIMDAVGKIKGLANTADNNNVYQLNIDLLKWL